MRYFWEGNIQFKVVNPEVSSDRFVEPVSQEPAEEEIISHPPSNSIRSVGLSLLRRYYKLTRKKVVNLSELLVSPEWHGGLSGDEDFLSCLACHIRYPNKPVPDFNSPVPI